MGYKMPKYRIQLKQGSRTHVEHGEFKSVQHVIQFYETLTTCKVSEILKVEYTNDTLPPIDDMSYFPLVKFIARNEESRKSNQVCIRNVKLTKDSTDVSMLIQQCMEIDGLMIDATICGMFKESRLNGE